MEDIENKVFLVTGGACGIGACLVKEYLEKGAKHVTILDINEREGRNLERELKENYGVNKAKFIKCDITTNELDSAYEEILSEFNYIDVVVNNAGVFDEREHVREIEVNLTALMTNSLKAYNLMRKDRGGRGGTVVNVSSALALANVSWCPVYSAIKSAVLKFSVILGMKQHYDRTNVRFLTLCFGATDTTLFDNFHPIDNECKKMVTEDLLTIPKQSPELAAKDAITVFTCGTSGSVWLVAANNEPKDVTGLFDDLHKAAYGL